ncbi:uncharacterized protein [Cicer arietinum]|uniref:LOB domain-containing protein 12-like n=1 Tax=Cicer arietinum TaxID=3827 RepID=A0A1S2Y2J7_CICAR|nr:LOB domain-containing protein 12-like [Cicer arietinum]
MDINKRSSNKACASCKFQRRKCSKDCPLAPYFPANKPKTFSNAHRLYGVSSISKLLKRINNDKKDEAMTSIIYESNIRSMFPIYGCTGVINILQGKLHNARLELNYIQNLLNICKQNYASQQQNLLPMGNNFISMPSTSCQIPNDPICNNIGDRSYFYDNSENNNFMLSHIIPNDVNNITSIDSKNELEVNVETGVSGVFSNGADIQLMEENSNLMATQGDLEHNYFGVDVQSAYDDYDTELSRLFHGEQHPPITPKDAPKSSSVGSGEQELDKNSKHGDK